MGSPNVTIGAGSVYVGTRALSAAGIAKLSEGDMIVFDVRIGRARKPEGVTL
jgi:cold shock CspA family protein